VTPGGDHRAIEDTLARYGRLTADAIEVLVADVGGRVPHLADVMADYPRRGGKGIRPALVLATCQAFGGTVREASGAATSIELLHNAFLIHDDIEDASTLRRGRPTLHQLYGVPLAVHAGDSLAMLAMRPLHEGGALGSRLQRLVVDEYLTMAQQTIEGQAKELHWRRQHLTAFDADDYLDLIAGKTCWYTTIYPLRVGALIGGRGGVDLEPIGRFAFYLGAAFQIRDDLLNLVGSADDIGKDLLGDLREGKRTLLLSHVLAEAGAADRAWLEGYLDRPVDARSDDDIRRLLDLMHHHHSVAYATEYAAGIAGAARETFDEAFAAAKPSPHRDFLRSMIGYMVDRRR
jgi:geranylgeranyl diphosphate synthase, type II